MSKFFVDKTCIFMHNITISGDDVAHISRVLRKNVGDNLTVCDGDGTDYECVISAVSKTEITCDIISKQPCPAEPDVFFTLYQAIPKSGKMDSIIQKSVELGASRIVPVLSHRCVAKGERNDRWQKIAEQAAKQCGRGIIPTVMPAVSYKEAVTGLATCDLSLFAYEEATDAPLANLLEDKNIKTAGVLIGPEGGFEPSEALLAKDAGIRVITLGKRILRTETAGAAVIAIVMHALGQMC